MTSLITSGSASTALHLLCCTGQRLREKWKANKAGRDSRKMLLGCVFPLAVYTHIQFFYFFRKKKILNQQPETTAMAASKHPPSEKPFKTLTVPTEPEPFPSFVQPPFFLLSRRTWFMLLRFFPFSSSLHFTLSHSRDGGSFIFTEKEKNRKTKNIFCVVLSKAKKKEIIRRQSSRKKYIKKKIHLNAFVCFLLHHRATLSYIRSNTSLAEVSANENFYLETLCHFQTTTSPDISHIFTGDAWRSEMKWVVKIFAFLVATSAEHTKHNTHTAQRLHWWCFCTSHRFSIPPGSAEQES